MISNADKDEEKPNLSYNAGGNIKWHSPSEKQFFSFLKNIPHNPAVTLPDIYSRESSCTQLFIAIL